MRLEVGDRWLMQDVTAGPASTTGAISEVIVIEAPNGEASLNVRTTVGWIARGDASSDTHGGQWKELERLPPAPPKGLVKFEWTELKSGSDASGDWLEVDLHAQIDGVDHRVWLRRGQVRVLADEDVVP